MVKRCTMFTSGNAIGVHPSTAAETGTRGVIAPTLRKAND
jgi:hypothetical protein